MKIGFDGKRAVHNSAGLGSYSRFLLKSLSAYYPENEYFVYAPRRHKNETLLKIIQNSNGNVVMRYPDTFWDKRFSSLWRVKGIRKDIRKDNIDVFHGLSGELPLDINNSNGGKCKSVVTVHDLIFLRYPEFYQYIDTRIYKYKYLKACQNADKIIAISECTKKDIIDFFDITEDKIQVIYQGCDNIFSGEFSPREKAEVIKKYSLPDHFVLAVGTIEERKNFLSAVKTLPLLPDDLHVVLVGRATKYAEKIRHYVEANNLTHRVHMLHNVPSEDLSVIYGCAMTFVYPSVYEGFGIPVIEAIHSGLPVVATTGSCLEEAGGPSSLYVHPDDITSMAKAIETTFDADKRASMIADGKQWVKKFSAQTMSNEIMQCYENLLSK